MYTPMVPCSSCSRHVRLSDDACPFCDADLASQHAAVRVVPEAPQRLTRAAAFVFGATIAVAGCDEGSIVAMYGAPSDVSSSSSSGTGGDGGKDGSGGGGGSGVAGMGGMGGKGAGGEAGMGGEGGEGGEGGAGGAAGQGGFSADYGAPPPP